MRSNAQQVLKEAGASGVFTFEGPFDVFTPLVLASSVKGLDVMSNVAIAFPRNPIQLAHQANDLQLLSEGRFILGLGTQVRAQIEKRYGAEFDQPVARMKEMVGALRAIFATWNDGRAARLPRRVLPAHLDDADLRTRARTRSVRRRSISERSGLG